MSFRCVYCGDTRNDSDSSREHIVPESLAGTLVTREVCAQCNGTLGSEVDGPFVDSYYLRFLRYSVVDFLPESAIPDFQIRAMVESQDAGDRFPGNLRFSVRGISFEPRFHREEVGDEVKYYLPDTPDGRKSLAGLIASKKRGIKRSEWVELPALPRKLQLPMVVRLVYPREIGKMLLGYIAYKLGPAYALDQKFDSLRDFVLGNRAELLDDSYYFRTGDIPSVPNKGPEVAHEIGFYAEDQYHLFRVVLFDSLLFEIELWG